MTCEEYGALLWAFLADELDQKQDALVRDHLTHCTSCQHRLEQVRRLAAAARALPDDSQSLSLWLETKEAVRVELERAGRAAAAFGPVMDADDLAKYLKVDVATVYRHLEEIPHFELEGQMRFRRESIDSWLESRERGQAVFGFPVRAVS